MRTCPKYEVWRNGKKHWRRAPKLPSDRVKAMCRMTDKQVARLFGVADYRTVARQRRQYNINNVLFRKTCFCGKVFKIDDARIAHCSGACARAWRYAAKPLKTLPIRFIKIIRCNDELRTIWASIALFDGLINWKLRNPQTRTEVYFEASRSHDKDAARYQRQQRSRRRMAKQQGAGE